MFFKHGKKSNNMNTQVGIPIYLCFSIILSVSALLFKNITLCYIFCKYFEIPKYYFFFSCVLETLLERWYSIPLLYLSKNILINNIYQGKYLLHLGIPKSTKKRKIQIKLWSLWKYFKLLESNVGILNVTTYLFTFKKVGEAKVPNCSNIN